MSSLCPGHTLDWVTSALLSWVQTPAPTHKSSMEPPFAWGLGLNPKHTGYECRVAAPVPPRESRAVGEHTMLRAALRHQSPRTCEAGNTLLPQVRLVLTTGSGSIPV